MARAQMSARLVRSAVAALCVGVGGCALTPPPAGPGPTVLKPITATVFVQNNNWSDVRIDVVSNGRRVARLGIVPALGTAAFVLPRAMPLPAEVELIAVLSGHDAPHVMTRVSTDRGTKLLVVLEQSGCFSTVTKLP